MNIFQYQLVCNVLFYPPEREFKTLDQAITAANLAARGVQGHPIWVYDNAGVACYRALLPKVTCIQGKIL